MFSLNIRYLKYLGICLQDPPELTSVFLKSIRSYVFLFIFVGLTLAGSVAFILRESSDLTAASGGLIIFAAGVSGIFSFISMGINVCKIKGLISEFQALVDKSMFLGT